MLKKTAKKKTTATKGKPDKAKAAVKKAISSKASAATKVHQTAGSPIKVSVPQAPFKQSELFNAFAEHCGLSKKQVQLAFELLAAIAKMQLVKNGPEQFTMPGLLKTRSVANPVTKAKKESTLFSPEEIMIKARVVKKVLKLKAVKKSKDQVQ